VGVRRVEDLIVWQLADRLHGEVVKLSRMSSGRRDFKFFDQFLSASRSVPANIAEGFARYHPREFKRFLQYARGSVAEVQVHLREAESRRFISPQAAIDLRTLSRRVGAGLTALIRSIPPVPPNHSQRSKAP
jgi:four helix bundle protein